MEHLSCEKKLKKLGLLSLEKRRPWGNLIAASQYLKGAYKKGGDKLFSRVCSNRTRGNGFEMASQYVKGAYKKGGDKLFSRVCSNRTRGNGFEIKEGRLRLDIRKKFFTRVVKHWKRFPREVRDAPSLETFQVRLDGALSNLV